MGHLTRVFVFCIVVVFSLITHVPHHKPVPMVKVQKLADSGMRGKKETWISGTCRHRSTENAKLSNLCLNFIT